MRRAQSERPSQGMSYQDPNPRMRGAMDPTAWVGMSAMFWSEYSKWMDFWQREVLRLWGIGPTMFALRGRRDGDMRRASDMPWLPRMEAQVIPLRRNTDPPGGEATRYSMRVPMPWSPATTNIVAVETIVGTGEGAQKPMRTAAPDQHPSSEGARPPGSE